MTDRQEFEKWAKTLAWSHFVAQFDTDDNGEYDEQATFRLYLCWLAARRSQSEQVRELVEAVEVISTDPHEPMSRMLGLKHARRLAAQLKEQQDAK
ncbi:hypothetical protein N9878_01340 [bacterium]|nr:hypothetical protein [bacterium]